MTYHWKRHTPEDVNELDLETQELLLQTSELSLIETTIVCCR